MQGWIGYHNPSNACNIYKAKTGANPFIYSFDLAGYGTLQFPEHQVFCLAGFSEKVFDLITKTFQRHGATGIDTPVFETATSSVRELGPRRVTSGRASYAALRL